MNSLNLMKHYGKTRIYVLWAVTCEIVALITLSSAQSFVHVLIQNAILFINHDFGCEPLFLSYVSIYEYTTEALLFPYEGMTHVTLPSKDN